MGDVGPIIAALLTLQACGSESPGADGATAELDMDNGPTGATAESPGSSAPESSQSTLPGEPAPGSSATSAPVETAGDEGLPACVAESQPQTRGSNESCYSPFYNPGLYTNPDVLGCDCEPCDHRETCIDGGQYLCGATWIYKDVGSCDVPNACVDIWLKTFRSAEMEDCERLAGGLLIGDADINDPVSCRIELRFSNYLNEQRFAAGSRDGDYRCNGMDVVGIFGPTEVNGVYDPESGILTWNGIEMQPVAEPL